MMNTRLSTIITLTLLLLPLAATCQPDTHNVPSSDINKQPAVEVLYANQQCGRSQTSPAVTWINNAQQLETRIRQIQGIPAGGKLPPLPKLDFQHEIALLVEMGQRPTLGYQMALTETESLRITQGQAYLTLDWIQPPADAMVAQMISSPCLLLKLKRGNYDSVQILDRQNTIRAETH
ncbi:MAG TPA: protease complex subunit PrcB family protein [Gammaproteobacteria bacterium]|nr:protease complex subunit PrcB family protein [Gammaproteobacteria bacterium]